QLLQHRRRDARRHLARSGKPRRGEVGVVARARDVQGDPEELGLDDAALLEPLGELLLAESLQTRPQRDVRGLRKLRLQHADALDRARHGQLAAAQQQLPLEQGAIQLPQRQYGLVYGITAALSRSCGGSAKSAGTSSSVTRCVISLFQGYAPLARKASAARTVCGVW